MLVIILLFVLIPQIFCNYESFVRKTGYSLQNSTACLDQLQAFLANMYNPDFNVWALEMIDATSRVHSNLMPISVGELGKFWHCLSLDEDVIAEGGYTGTIMGKYCLGTVTFPRAYTNNYMHNLVVRLKYEIKVQDKCSSITHLGRIENSTNYLGPTWAICVPHGCSTADINLIVNSYIREELNESLSLVFTDMLCQTMAFKQKIPEDAIVGEVIFFLYGILLFTATMYDVTTKIHQRGGSNTETLQLSVYSNTKKLFQIYDDDERIKCADGIRFLSIMWVVLGHQYAVTCAGAIYNAVDLTDWSTTLFSQVIGSSPLAADTFFVVGSGLITYSYFKHKEARDTFNIPLYYLRRYLRLTPSLAAAVLFTSTLLNFMGSGPRWPTVKPFLQDNCQKFWWSSLLYIQNFVNGQNLCIGPTWFLSIYFQLYLLTHFIFLAISKWKKTVFCCLSVSVIVCAIVTFVQAWRYEITPILTNPHGNMENYNNQYNVLIYTRAGPWLMGIILGYKLFEIKTGAQHFFIRDISYFFWAGWSIITLFCVFLPSIMAPIYSKTFNAIYLALISPLWALVVSFLIIACETDNKFIGRNVNEFLSHRVFQLLNRFTYAIYLTHLPLMYIISLNNETPEYFSNFRMIYKYWGFMFFNFVVAFVWVLAFEMPFVGLGTILIDRIRGVRTCVPRIVSSSESEDDENEEIPMVGQEVSTQRRESAESEETVPEGSSVQVIAEAIIEEQESRL